MKLKIVAVGSNDIIAQEIKEISETIIGNAAEITAATTSALVFSDEVDLYVCAVTQQNPLSEKVPENKVCVLDLRPTAPFFIQVSHIPAGEKVHIFNSNIAYARLLKDLCENMNIKNVELIPIAYEDMGEKELICHLKNAKYIIGVEELVGKEVLLSEKYLPYLRDDVTVIGERRMATMQTASLFMQRVSETLQRKTTREIARLASRLKDMPENGANADEYRKIASEIEMLIEHGSSDIAVKENILKSFYARLSRNLGVEDGKRESGKTESKAEMLRALEEIDLRQYL